ncbi:MAG: hypothetical protein K2N28_03450 [Muribaculaceae bacterium]|nr:hypothetical protein [Muribaculaceae bacterium]
MNYLKQLCVAATVSLSMTSQAANYHWLTFRMTDGSEMSVAADNLEATYADGYMQLSSSTVNQTIKTSDIKSMRFTEENAAGIDDIETDDNTNADYYTVAGVYVGTFTSPGSARESLGSGTYIAKNKVKTFKVIF